MNAGVACAERGFDHVMTVMQPEDTRPPINHVRLVVTVFGVPLEKAVELVDHMNDTGEEFVEGFVSMTRGPLASSLISPAAEYNVFVSDDIADLIESDEGDPVKTWNEA